MGRFKEVGGVKFQNVTVLPGGSLELFIASAKNYWQGNQQTVVIAPTGREDCPVN